MVNIVLFYVYWLNQLLQVHKLIAFIQVLDRKSIELLFNNIIKPRQCYSSSVNHVTTLISIMFSRIGVNENFSEFVSNYFVPTIQESCKVLVKRHVSYNLCPTPIKKNTKDIHRTSQLSFSFKIESKQYFIC